MVDKSMHVLKTKSFFLWIFLLAVILWTCTYYSLTVIKDYSSERHSLIMPEYQNFGYLIKTPSCRIPEMYVNGPNINSYMSYSDELNCKSKWNYNLPLVTSNLTALILNMSALTTLNIDINDPLFKCQYSAIESLPTSEEQRSYKYYNKNDYEIGEEKYFKHSITVPDEMVEVICTFNENIIYIDYHIFIRPSPSVKSRTDGDISVLILGLDGVSRLNFHRHMPKTNAFLSQLGNVELLGYNKVEDNTFPNLIPVLTGLSVDELKKRCWHHDDDFFDDCDFVWDDFKNANFDTSFMEDSPMLGLFHYLKSGFLNKPVDHYLRPIMIQAEGKIGHQHRDNVICCIGSQLGMTALFNYAYRVASSMADHSYMGFFWSSSLTHDYIEYPRFGDDDLRAFFDRFNRSGELNKTVLVLMSDHGIRWGSYRNTYQGSLEDRLPMLRFIIPEWFKNAYPKAVRNLNGNAVRLTTPYDLHETLLDLVDVRLLADEAIEARAETDANAGRGTSLFLEISENKTCQTAGIPKHYCACHEVRTVLAVNDANVVSAASFLMESINAKLSGYTLCAKLSLHEINKATVETGKDGARSVRDYEIRVTTLPGYAKFEATMRQDGQQFNILGSLSRLNAYRDQSICVNDALIKLLCYCIH